MMQSELRLDPLYDQLETMWNTKLIPKDRTVWPKTMPEVIQTLRNRKAVHPARAIAMQLHEHLRIQTSDKLVTLFGLQYDLDGMSYLDGSVTRIDECRVALHMRKAAHKMGVPLCFGVEDFAVRCVHYDFVTEFAPLEEQWIRELYKSACEQVDLLEVPELWLC